MIKPLPTAITEVLLVALLGATFGILISDTPINSILLPLPHTSAIEPSQSPDYTQSNTKMIQK
jgi:hypothetical protein